MLSPSGGTKILSPSGGTKIAMNVHYPELNQVKSEQGSEMLSQLVQVKTEQGREELSQLV